MPEGDDRISQQLAFIMRTLLIKRLDSSFHAFSLSLGRFRDERLALLMELRKFRQQHPEQFRRIQNLPLRARVGRSDPTRAGSTVTFIRSHRRDGFYRLKGGAGILPAGSGGVPAAELPLSHPMGEGSGVRAGSALEEITVLEAAREFRAPDPKEKAIPLHPAHHHHVNAALARFKEQSTAQTLQAEVADAAQGPNERRATSFNAPPRK